MSFGGCLRPLQCSSYHFPLRVLSLLCALLGVASDFPVACQITSPPDFYQPINLHCLKYQLPHTQLCLTLISLCSRNTLPATHLSSSIHTLHLSSNLFTGSPSLNCDNTSSVLSFRFVFAPLILLLYTVTVRNPSFLFVFCVHVSNKLRHFCFHNA